MRFKWIKPSLICNRIFNRTLMALAKKGEMITIKKKRDIYRNIELSDHEKQAIDAIYTFWIRKQIRYDWHKLYKSYTGKFDQFYFPDYLFSSCLELKWNQRSIANALSDKNLQNIVFGNMCEVKTPHTYIRCINRVYQEENMNIVRLKDVLEKLNNSGEVVFKATINTDSGKGVRICNIVNGVDIYTKDSLRSVIEKCGDNFIVQERIKASELLSTIYPDAINTFRVITYILNGDIYIAPIVLRMGRNGAKVDNIHYGGIFVAVNDDGTLYKTAFSEKQERFLAHPDSCVVFENTRLECVDKLKNAAIALHHRIPQLGMISWDLTIDEQENVVLIEANTIGQSIWFPQMAHGCGVFGENTPVILEYLRSVRG